MDILGRDFTLHGAMLIVAADPGAWLDERVVHVRAAFLLQLQNLLVAEMVQEADGECSQLAFAHSSDWEQRFC